MPVTNERCPYLRPDIGSRPGRTVPVYCALPLGRVRVPDPDEIARFCAPGAFDRCPTYDRAKARCRALEGLV